MIRHISRTTGAFQLALKKHCEKWLKMEFKRIKNESNIIFLRKVQI